MKYKIYFLIFLVFVVSIRILYIWNGPFGLTPDEAHYWEWSRRLDLSYYSKGPAVAYIIAFFTAIFGDTEFGVRIGAVLASLASSVLLYVITRDVFKSDRAAFFSALLPNFTPLYSVGSILMTTDAPFIMAWGLCVYLLRNAVKEESWTYWYMAGLIAGIGLLSKYTMAMIFPCFFLYLIFIRNDRCWLFRKEPYIALFISLIIFSPVIFWNMKYDWVTIKHTMGQAHVEAGIRLSIGSFLEFIGGQVGLLTPFIFTGLIYGVLKCGFLGYRNNNRDYLFLFFMSAPVLFFFLLKSIQGKVQGNWAAAGYFTAFIATAGIWDEIYKRYERGKSKGKGVLSLLIFFAFLIGITSNVLVHYPVLLESIGIKGVRERAPYNRIIGWREAGKEIGKVYSEMKREKDVFIISDTYQNTSELAFYMPGNPIVYNVYSGNRRMNQYDIWPGYDSFIGRDGLYIKGGDTDIEQMVADAFDICKGEMKEIDSEGRLVRKLTIFRCYNFKGMEGIEKRWSY